MALTQREEQVLALLGKGMTNREIGGQLFVSVNTVKYHVQNIYQKLGVHNRTQAIVKTAKKA